MGGSKSNAEPVGCVGGAADKPPVESIQQKITPIYKNAGLMQQIADTLSKGTNRGGI